MAKLDLLLTSSRVAPLETISLCLRLSGCWPTEVAS
jgi:hypothetical protein